MSDYSELKRTAEKAPTGPWVVENDSLFFKEEGYTRHMLDADAGHDVSEKDYYAALKFIAAANPAIVLALIAEVDRLTADNTSLRGSCAKLGVEHAGMVRIHRKANTEIRRLHAEVEDLRKDAERYRWLREKVGVDLIFGDYSPWLLSCNTDMTDLEKKTTDAAIDAAMTKGSKP